MGQDPLLRLRSPGGGDRRRALSPEDKILSHGFGPMVRILHLTDLHLTKPTLGGLLREPTFKRFCGYLNWLLRRRHHFQNHLLDRLLQTLSGLRLDQIVITGDLTQLGLLEEFKQVERWLAAIREIAPTMVVPGNHDLYGPSSWNHLPACCRLPFPIQVDLGHVALIGLNTARPFPFPLASGELDRNQLLKLAQWLDRTRGRFRIVALHHPPDPEAVPRRKALRNGAELLTLLQRDPPDLVIHGHTHRWRLYWLQGRVPVLSLPPPHYRRDGLDGRPTFHIYQIEPEGRWEVQLYQLEGKGYRLTRRLRFHNQPRSRRRRVGQEATHQAGRS